MPVWILFATIVFSPKGAAANFGSLSGQGAPQQIEQSGEARKLVEARLAELKARNATIVEITDRNVREAIPARPIFAVRFRMYPVAIAPPEPLKSQNLFIVHDNKVSEVSDSAKLEPWFRRHISRQRSEADMRRAVRAWLILSEELKQDGFYKFLIHEDSISLAMRMDDIEATGKALVTDGGKGEICVTITFEKAGVASHIAEVSTVKPGVRPICQATKLLDKDPIVRKMAEQDILVMGRAGKPYLDEQRAKANPMLKQAIDKLWARIVFETR